MATIMQIVNADRNLALFANGLKRSGLEETLNKIGPYTILGPVNLALGKLMSLSYQELLAPANKSKLVEFLSAYIFPGKKMLSDFRNNQTLASLEGKTVTSNIVNGEIHVNGAKILAYIMGLDIVVDMNFAYNAPQVFTT